MWSVVNINCRPRANSALSTSLCCFIRPLRVLLRTYIDKSYLVVGSPLVCFLVRAGGGSSDNVSSRTALHPYLNAVLARDPMFLELLPMVTSDIARLAAANTSFGEALLPKLCALVRTLDSLNSPAVAALLAGKAANATADVPVRRV